jgi:hypothetical protein
MADWLSQYSPKELIGLASVIGGVLFLIIIIVSSHWAGVRRAEINAHLAEQELALKQQMLERGMSAEEIVLVLNAGQAKTGRAARKKDAIAAES